MSALPAEDDLAIRDLVARYADAVCRRDAEAWLATWAPECSWDLGGGRVAHGPHETLALWQSSIAKYPWVAQLPTSGRLESVDGQACGQWYLLELNHRADATAVMHLGHYADTYIRVAGGWRFRTRQFHLIYRGAMDPGQVWPLPPSARPASG